MKNRIIGKKRKGSNGFANNKSDVDDDNNNRKNIVIYHGAEPYLSPFPNIKEKARAKFGIYLDNDDNKIKRKRRIALALGFKTSTKGWDILNEIDIPETG